jgi:hypothetical protein
MTLQRWLLLMVDVITRGWLDDYSYIIIIWSIRLSTTSNSYPLCRRWTLRARLPAANVLSHCQCSFRLAMCPPQFASRDAACYNWPLRDVLTTPFLTILAPTSYGCCSSRGRSDLMTALPLTILFLSMGWNYVPELRPLTGLLTLCVIFR